MKLATGNDHRKEDCLEPHRGSGQPLSGQRWGDRCVRSHRACRYRIGRDRGARRDRLPGDLFEIRRRPRLCGAAFRSGAFALPRTKQGAKICGVKTEAASAGCLKSVTRRRTLPRLSVSRSAPQPQIQASSALVDIDAISGLESGPNSRLRRRSQRTAANFAAQSLDRLGAQWGPGSRLVNLKSLMRSASAVCGTQLHQPAFGANRQPRGVTF
jgi:hypothetical protein